MTVVLNTHIGNTYDVLVPNGYIIIMKVVCWHLWVYVCLSFALKLINVFSIKVVFEIFHGEWASPHSQYIKKNKMPQRHVEAITVKDMLLKTMLMNCTVNWLWTDFLVPLKYMAVLVPTVSSNFIQRWINHNANCAMAWATRHLLA